MNAAGFSFLIYCVFIIPSYSSTISYCFFSVPRSKPNQERRQRLTDKQVTYVCILFVFQNKVKNIPLSQYCYSTYKTSFLASVSQEISELREHINVGQFRASSLFKNNNFCFLRFLLLSLPVSQFLSSTFLPTFFSHFVYLHCCLCHVKLCCQSLHEILYLRTKNMHCIHGTQGVQTLVLFFFRLRMPSASSPALSRVVSPNSMHVLCCCLR